MRRKIQQNKS